MPQFAEVIYETGSKSVVQVDSLDDLKAGLAEQHRRAMAGEPGGPIGQPAERIKKVLLYDDHPGSLNEGQLVNVADLSKAIESEALGGEVSRAHVDRALTSLLSPVYMPPANEDPADWRVKNRHQSQYKMKESKELKLDFLPKDGEA